MAIMLALGAAAFYGSSDFVGAIASRRASVLTVAFGAQLTGLVVLLATLPLLAPAVVGRGDLLAGAAAGVVGGLGVVAVYQALARGPMSIVAPTTALSASAVPVLAGLLRGERPGTAALAGIAVAFVAVALITREAPADGGSRARISWSVVAPALAAGAVVGLFFVFLDGAHASAGLWPLLAARLTSVPVLGLLIVLRGARIGRGTGLLGPVLVSGALDMAANVLFLLASHHGMLAVVAALTGLYPASTIVLAQTRLGERMQPVQLAGLGVAALAAAMVAS